MGATPARPVARQAGAYRPHRAGRAHPPAPRGTHCPPPGRSPTRSFHVSGRRESCHSGDLELGVVQRSRREDDRVNEPLPEASVPLIAYVVKKFPVLSETFILNE